MSNAPASDRAIRQRILATEREPLRVRIFVNVALALVGLFFLFPIAWMLILSFKTQTQITSMPPDLFSSFTLENYRSVLNVGVTYSTVAKASLMENKSNEFLQGLFNTAVVAFFSVAISALVGIPAAYGLSRYKNALKDQLAFTFLSFRFVPQLLVIIPLYLIYLRIGLYGTYFGIIWASSLVSIPFVVWITRSYMDDIPIEIEEAALMDGHTRRDVFFRIILPLAKPGIAASIIISFIAVWNNFTFGFVLATTRLQPVTVKILSFYDITDLNYGRIAAAMMLATLPMILVSQIAAKYLVSGMSMGAVRK
jgi:multiple sugar transport system permease protein